MAKPKTLEEQDAHKVRVLLKLCEDYQTHLNKAEKKPGIDEASTKLLSQKKEVIEDAITKLKSTDSFVNNKLKLIAVKEHLQRNSETLHPRRDTSLAVRFLESAMKILSGGKISNNFKLFKSQGESLGNKVEKELGDDRYKPNANIK